MKLPKAGVINDNIFNSGINPKIKGRNPALLNSHSSRILKVNKNLQSGLSEHKRIIHIKKLSFKRPLKPVTFEEINLKKFHAKRINSSFEHFQKISNLFSARLSKQILEKEGYKKDFYSNNNNKLPKLFSFNENINIYQPKSNSISYNKNKQFHSKFQFNPYFPFIKKVKNEDNKIRNIQMNSNNFHSLLKNKKLINNVENSNSAGYKSIYLSLDFEKQKVPNVIQNYINKIKLINNSKSSLGNKNKRDLMFQRQKKLKDVNFNSFLKVLYRNKSEVNMMNSQNNEEKTSVQSDQNLDTDLMLNDKGTLINFNDVMNK